MIERKINKLLVSRRDAAEALSLSLRKIDYLVAAGVLGAKKIGSRTLIFWSEIERLAKAGTSK